MTTKPCPECGHPLHVKLEAGHVTLWCAYGPCPSWAANQGATAPTAEEAFAKLSEAVGDPGLARQFADKIEAVIKN